MNRVDPFIKKKKSIGYLCSKHKGVNSIHRGRGFWNKHWKTNRVWELEQGGERSSQLRKPNVPRPRVGSVFGEHRKTPVATVCSSWREWRQSSRSRLGPDCRIQNATEINLDFSLHSLRSHWRFFYLFIFLFLFFFKFFFFFLKIYWLIACYVGSSFLR